MALGGRGHKVPRKIFICQYCSNEFTVDYIGENSKKVIKTCSNCKSIVKKEAALILRDGGTDHSQLINKAKNLLLSKGFAMTFADLCRELKCSSKTLRAALSEKSIYYTDLLKEVGLHSKGMSKFQQKVLVILHEIFPNKEIVSEKTFDDLINPKTGNHLRIDFYLPSLKMAIECDGLQHSDENHYFNQLTIKNGHTPSQITDSIKEEYCKQNNIRLVRIPYKKVITESYIYNLLK